MGCEAILRRFGAAERRVVERLGACDGARAATPEPPARRCGSRLGARVGRMHATPTGAMDIVDRLNMTPTLKISEIVH